MGLILDTSALVEIEKGLAAGQLGGFPMEEPVVNALYHDLKYNKA